MDNSPVRNLNLVPSSFSPLKLTSSPSPLTNLTGTKRVVKDLAADIFNNIQKWNSLHIKGCALVKIITDIKQDDPNGLSERLEDACTQLADTVNEMEQPKNNLIKFKEQTRSLSRLSSQSSNLKPIFISLDIKFICSLVDFIVDAYQAEYADKVFIAEQIAFTKSIKETMFLTVLWTYQTYINKDVNLKLETLLVESGHRKIC